MFKFGGNKMLNTIFLTFVFITAWSYYFKAIVNKGKITSQAVIILLLQGIFVMMSIIAVKL